MPMTINVSLSDLPESILMYIAGFLCLKDFFTLCSVSKNFADIFSKYLKTGSDRYYNESFTYKAGMSTRKLSLSLMNNLEERYPENLEKNKQQLLYATLIALEKVHSS
ncbi:uncharacterized protein Gasu_12350 [Galdieria sulphuraria]|uniref:F-box domain-containing protein n=1 Tax=Galdieria sulphuraria TaxID=130081 RepID=M2Y6A5_GALSU|nr:uncharacterized protein Gasu_12350 [Galdieria sulphuraria]EME31563.1 hypothetical protein Gasu_12350 [Galdieria sulphuraria]|eukprot:XP_005708083.1 hypothetical protein Gasu_12350 [Galdieria sulphuraria]